MYTLATTAVLTFFQVLSTGLAAYSFARLNKGKMKIVSKILFAMVVFTIVVPSDCIMLAQFSTFRSFDLFGIIKALTGSGINMTKNMASMIVLAATGMGVKSGLYIYILRQGIRGLPYSIEEAAFVDGAGFLRTFFQIVVPSASGSILTVSVLSFLWNYTDVYYNSLLNQNTLQLAYNYHQLQGNIRWPIGNAAKMHATWLSLINAENPYVQKHRFLHVHFLLYFRFLLCTALYRSVSYREQHEAVLAAIKFYLQFTEDRGYEMPTRRTAFVNFPPP